MQIGFIGIGVMGRPMTLNLLKAEHHVTIYARHPDKPEVQEVLKAGAKLAPSPRAVAMASDIVITMLPNSPQVEEVVTGPQGILEGARKGLIIVDMSTIAPAVSRKLAQTAIRARRALPRRPRQRRLTGRCQRYIDHHGRRRARNL